MLGIGVIAFKRNLKLHGTSADMFEYNKYPFYLFLASYELRSECGSRYWGCFRGSVYPSDKYVTPRSFVMLE